jgi:hypothetical protein
VLPSLPRPLLLLDGIGALLTAASMVFLLAPFENTFGLPVRSAYAFGAVATLFACFSLSSTMSAKANHASRLRVIAAANFSYCIVSLAVMLAHQDVLTLLGYLYLSLEVLIVSALASYELKIARQSSSE